MGKDAPEVTLPQISKDLEPENQRLTIRLVQGVRWLPWTKDHLFIDFYVEGYNKILKIFTIYAKDVSSQSSPTAK
jgi:hypothetical protein